MTVAVTPVTTAAPAHDPHVIVGVDDDPLDAVRRALSLSAPDLVGRVRARILAYRAADRCLFVSSFSHIASDYSVDEVMRVVELLVDLRELGPDKGLYSRMYPPVAARH